MRFLKVFFLCFIYIVGAQGLQAASQYSPGDVRGVNFNPDAQADKIYVTEEGFNGEGESVRFLIAVSPAEADITVSYLVATDSVTRQSIDIPVELLKLEQTSIDTENDQAYYEIQVYKDDLTDLGVDGEHEISFNLGLTSGSFDFSLYFAGVIIGNPRPEQGSQTQSYSRPDIGAGAGNALAGSGGCAIQTSHQASPDAFVVLLSILSLGFLLMMKRREIR